MNNIVGASEFNTRTPAVDVASLNGIESMFRGSARDPWARKMAGNLADLFVYADSITYMQPVGKDDQPGQRPKAPHPLIEALERYDPGVFGARTYPTEPPLKPDDGFVDAAFDRFYAWVRANETRVKGWLRVQRQPWIKKIKRSAGRHVFDLERFETDKRFVQLAEEMKEKPRGMVHLFDVNIRIPYYVELLGERALLATHPVRDSFCVPSMHIENVSIRPPPIRFGESISKFVHELTRDQFVVLLHELRREVRNRNLRLLGPGEVEREQIREICKAVHFPPKVQGKILQWIETVTAPIPIVGVVVSVLRNVWTGRLPRPTDSRRLQWLHPCVEWDLEEQAAR